MNKKLIISISILLIIIVIILSLLLLISNNKVNPDDSLKEYMQYISEQNYDAMYELIDSGSKNNTSKEDFVTRNKNIYEGIEASNIQIQILEKNKIDNKISEIKYKTIMDTLAGNISFENTVTLVKEEKTYKIVWKSNIIFPNLGDTDKVKVSVNKATRGSILDRNNIEIAKQGTVSSVGLVPGKMNDDTKENDIQRLSELLDISVDSINKNLNASYVKEDTFVAIKNVSKDNTELKQQLLEIKGIKITDATARVYPYSDITSHLVGYVQSITADELKENSGKGYTTSSVIGKSGLEKVYEDRLKGTNGCEIYILDSDGNKKSTIAKTNVQNGENIKLTIDIELQKKIYDEFKDDKSCSIAMNPKTGEILAMVSTPSYDSNDFILGISNSKWNSLVDDEAKPLYNRYQGIWTPGSSFKPIIAAIGLTTGKMDENEDYGTSGTSWQKDASWGTYKITTLAQYSEKANLQNALIYSDNIYFAKSALKIGAETLKEQLIKIGFNKFIDFPQSMNQSQYSNNNDFDNEIKLADTGYGQGEVLVNPLHIASIYSAFINEGNMIKPYIEYKENMQQVEYYVENAFSKEAANIIKEDLIQVLENPNGTANSAKIDNIKIAGKTGTAEIKSSKDDTTGTEIGWFNAFIADENSNRQLLLISMVEDVKNKGGSHYVLSKAKAIFESVLK